MTTTTGFPESRALIHLKTQTALPWASGELIIHGTDVQIRGKRTIPPTHDPYPPSA
jgi:hypothetical protein